MYTFIYKNIFHCNNNKMLLQRLLNMMFDALRIMQLQLKNVHDLSYDHHLLKYIFSNVFQHFS
jgi:hypothetical protein